MNYATLTAMATLTLIHVPLAAHAQQRVAENPQIDSRVEALCGEKLIYFDGACRGQRFFGRLAAKGFELRGYSGCGSRSPASESSCGERASLTEAKDELTRTVTLSIASAVDLDVPRRRREGSAINSVRRAGFPMRGDYLIVSRTNVRSEARAGGDRAIDISLSTLDTRTGLREVMTQDLLLDAVDDDATGRDYTVAGQACFASLPTQTDSILDGSPDCTCLDEGSCMRGDYSTTGVSIAPTGKGFRYCSTTSRYDAALNGLLQSEFEFDLLQRRTRRDADGDGDILVDAVRQQGSNDSGLTCYQVSGAAASGLLQTYSQEQSGGNSTCGPDIATGTDLGAVACNTVAIAASTFGGISATPFEVEIGFGIDGRGLSVKNIILNAIENSEFAYEYLGDLCASTGLSIAALDIAETFCLGSGQGGGSCAGSHSSVPVTVTATNGQTCSATANLECQSSTGQSVDLLSPLCECTPTSVQVDEASCR